MEEPVACKEFDVAALEPDLAYKLLVGAVQPRPIAWVSTIDEEGIANLAPFSFFTVASRSPATILFSLTEKESGSIKDTLRNLRRTGDFVVNIPSFRHLGAVGATSAPVAPEVDEFELAGLTALPSVKVQSPRLAETALSLECRLSQQVELGADTVVFGEVLWAHVAEGVMDERVRVDNDVLQPLGRLAGPWFTGPLTAVPQVDSLASAVPRG
jgi:flavin reductase (DIM6/NTAB) family NADH-FMN oxidoreductase RutF